MYDGVFSQKNDVLIKKIRFLKNYKDMNITLRCFFLIFIRNL